MLIGEMAGNRSRAPRWPLAATATAAVLLLGLALQAREAEADGLSGLWQRVNTPFRNTCHPRFVAILPHCRSREHSPARGEVRCFTKLRVFSHVLNRLESCPKVREHPPPSGRVRRPLSSLRVQRVGRAGVRSRRVPPSVAQPQERGGVSLRPPGLQDGGL